MQPYGKDSVVSGQLIDWGGMYVKTLQDIYNGTWTNEDMWWLAAEKAAILGGSFDEIINSKFINDLKAVKTKAPDLGDLSVYDLVLKRYVQMQKGVEAFDPFEGPVKDNSGKEQIKAGSRASKQDLLSMMYYVDNVNGTIPK
jgi:simple sugar transport system substrate-binding protein